MRNSRGRRRSLPVGCSERGRLEADPAEPVQLDRSAHGDHAVDVAPSGCQQGQVTPGGTADDADRPTVPAPNAVERAERVSQAARVAARVADGYEAPAPVRAPAALGGLTRQSVDLPVVRAVRKIRMRRASPTGSDVLLGLPAPSVDVEHGAVGGAEVGRFDDRRMPQTAVGVRGGKGAPPVPPRPARPQRANATSGFARECASREDPHYMFVLHLLPIAARCGCLIPVRPGRTALRRAGAQRPEAPCAPSPAGPRRPNPRERRVGTSAAARPLSRARRLPRRRAE